MDAILSTMHFQQQVFDLLQHSYRSACIGYPVLQVKTTATSNPAEDCCAPAVSPEETATRSEAAQARRRQKAGQLTKQRPIV